MHPLGHRYEGLDKVINMIDSGNLPEHMQGMTEKEQQIFRDGLVKERTKEFWKESEPKRFLTKLKKRNELIQETFQKDSLPKVDRKVGYIKEARFLWSLVDNQYVTVKEFRAIRRFWGDIRNTILLRRMACLERIGLRTKRQESLKVKLSVRLWLSYVKPYM